MSETKYTLITGASSGIGKALAYYCAELRMNLVLISLPAEGLADVALDISEKYNVITRYFEIDLTGYNAPEQVINFVNEAKLDINILINNAGVSGASIFENSRPEYIDQRIMLNIRATTLLTRYFVPVLKANTTSFILNVSSMAGIYPIPFKATYSASKAYIIHFSRALRPELRKNGINISVLCPTGVRTNGIMQKRMDQHTIFARISEVSTEEVAKTAINHMLKKKFLIIPGWFNRVVFTVSKIIPSFVSESFINFEYRKEVQSSMESSPTELVN